MSSTNHEVLEALRCAFPQLFTRRDEDGQQVERIDLEKIRLLAGDGNYSDRYGLRWEDKPERFDAESVGKLPTLKHASGKGVPGAPNKPNHVLIQGDNYHALKVLAFTHERSVDVIYIDPPYNTGNKDFKYNDRFVDKEDGYRHSKWLSFMAKRLKLAKALLKDTGTVFISIDSNEQAALKLLCDEVFGEASFVGMTLYKKQGGGKADSKFLALNHEYVLVYVRDPSKAQFNQRIGSTDHFNKVDAVTGRRYRLQPLAFASLTYSKSLDYVVTSDSGEKLCAGGNWAAYEARKSGSHAEKDWRWRVSSQEFERRRAEGRVRFVRGRDGSTTAQEVCFQPPDGENLIPYDDYFDDVTNRTATSELKELFGGRKVFSHPKPVALVKHLLKIPSGRDHVVLDFFAGSGTTGHAVLQLNAEDGGTRQCILVTNDEGEFKDDAGNVLPGGICTHVTYPRLKKVIEGYTTPKGKEVAGLGENLEFFETAFQAVPKSRRQLQSFVRHSTSLLQLKAGCFTSVETKPEWSLHTDGSKHLFILFDDCAVEAALERLRTVEGPVVAYVFAYDSDDDSAEILGQLPNVTVQEVPQPLLDLFFRIKE